jgi:hypothetical protein
MRTATRTMMSGLAAAAMLWGAAAAAGQTTCPGDLDGDDDCDVFDFAILAAHFGTSCVDADADGFTVAEGDCDDEDATVFPGADEVCDEKDNDCDGEIDEDPVDGQTWYQDLDWDEYGDDLITIVTCEWPGPDWTDVGGDCNDSDPTVWPGAPEYCDEQDNDCDGQVDEDAVDAVVWYWDGDADRYGVAGTTLLACDPPGIFWASQAGDCDDSHPLVNPGAPEVCDGLDNNCDGMVDNDPVVGPRWYPDVDSDGFGDIDTWIIACTSPGFEWIDVGGDCDDADPEVYPGATEWCDGKDNDCDGQIDEGCP